MKVVPLQYKNGVYYFPVTRDDFANVLAEFIKEHPELELVTIAGDGTGSDGYDRGYFVIFSEKQVPPSSSSSTSLSE